jgi:cell wall-associated NlpC family hydrolase
MTGDDEAAERAALVAEARAWVGTPYHTGARLRGIGADCLTVIVGAFENAGLIPRIETLPHYPADWHMHSDEPLYENGIARFCDDAPGCGGGMGGGAAPLPGDIVLFKYGRQFAHGAIVTAWPLLVHAFVRRPVTEDDYTREMWLRRIGENVPEKGQPRPWKVKRLKRWCR